MCFVLQNETRHYLPSASLTGTFSLFGLAKVQISESYLFFVFAFGFKKGGPALTVATIRENRFIWTKCKRRNYLMVVCERTYFI